MEIISGRGTVHCTERRYHYHWDGHPGWGFVFDVDEDDRPVADNPAAQANLEMCLRGEDPETGQRLIDDGIEVRAWDYVEPAVGRCSCGREVVLSGFTNTCLCGADYNSSGQQLAPREQWGEETGESLGDILRIP